MKSQQNDSLDALRDDIAALDTRIEALHESMQQLAMAMEAQERLLSDIQATVINATTPIEDQP